MPLPLPRLDDRDFDQLVDEARETLPLNAPGWTDHNASDPGITLVELFAYLTEIGLYRLDRVRPAERRAFLRLLGFPQRPAQVAQTVLSFAQGAASGASLRANVRVHSAHGGVVFQTTASLDVGGAALVSVLASHGNELIDRTEANRVMRDTFAPLGEMPALADALYLGFDQPLGPAGTRVRLHVFGADGARDRQTWRRLAAESRAARRDVRVACPAASVATVGRYWEHYSARLAWEYFDVSGEWRPLARVRDRTRALSISGPVHFRLPRPADHAAGGAPGFPAPFFIRARLCSGEYDCAPMINGARINAVTARHAADVEKSESFEAFFGHARHECPLLHTPVAHGSTHLELTPLGGSPEIRTEVANWDRTGPLDRHYVVDSESGVVVFGDGRQGRVPPAGAKARVTYRVGGGAVGNVAAGTLSGATGTGFIVSQPVAATGGADAEPIDAAEGRALRGLAQQRCAVTLQDFERLALDVPGVPVARAHAIASFHPTLSRLPAAGCVTVVVVPSCVDRRPEPSVALCRAVARYLDRRRPIACEVHVVGPSYTRMSVHAVLHLAPGADRVAAIGRAQDALRRFFHPLHGGSSNEGWPVGRDVFRSEVLALLASLPSVEWVGALLLTARAVTPASEARAGCSCGESQEDDHTAGRCGNVSICAHGLVLSGEHRIEVA